MSQKKAIKSLTQLEEQFAALKETINVERLTVLGIEEVLTKIKFVHPEIHRLIEYAAYQRKLDLEGQDHLKVKSIQEAEKQRDITIKHINKEHEENVKKVRKIMIQDVFYKMHMLKNTNKTHSQVQLSKRIDKMRTMYNLTTKHIMPISHSKASTAELEFDLSIIKRNEQEIPFHLQPVNDSNGVLIYFVPEHHLIRYIGNVVKAGEEFYMIMNHQRILVRLQQVRSREVISVKFIQSNEEKVFTVNEIKSTKLKLDFIEKDIRVKVEQ